MEQAYVFLHLPKTGGTTLNEHFKSVCTEEGRFVHLPDPKWNAYSKSEKQAAQILGGHGAYYGLHRQIDRPCRYFTILRDPFERFVSGHFYMKKIEDGLAAHSLEAHLNRWVLDRHDPIGSYRDRNEMLRFLAKMTRGRFWRWVYGNPWGQRCIRVVRRFARTALPGSIYSLTLDWTDRIWLRRCKRFLDQCWFVGVVEQSDEDFPALLKGMGLPDAYQDQNQGKERASSRRKRYADDPRFSGLYAAFRRANAHDFALYAHALKVRADQKA